MIESMSDLQRYDNIETIAIWHNYTETYAHDKMVSFYTMLYCKNKLMHICKTSKTSEIFL